MENAIEIFRPKWLKTIAKIIGYYPDDLCILKRKAKSGYPTFAVGYDAGGRTFPWIILEDLPIKAIKGALMRLRKYRILRKKRIHLYFFNIEDLTYDAELGYDNLLGIASENIEWFEVE